MIEYTNNPIGEVVNVCDRLYGKDCELMFVEGIKETDNAWAATVQPDDGSKPQICIDVSSPYMAVIELIAHEYAHVVAGHDAGHGTEWEKVFDCINIEFNSVS